MSWWWAFRRYRISRPRWWPAYCLHHHARGKGLNSLMSWKRTSMQTGHSMVHSSIWTTILSSVVTWWMSCLVESTIHQQLEKDVLDFLELIPILYERGLPNSRGIILSPGTGKTMHAKSIAAEAATTTILISAEIRQRHDIKSTFKLARKLAPTWLLSKT